MGKGVVSAGLECGVSLSVVICSLRLIATEAAAAAGEDVAGLDCGLRVFITRSACLIARCICVHDEAHRVCIMR